ncbi:MAG: putative collagen-binding domain-containing protein [Pyrinomonadaceae bacterium]
MWQGTRPSWASLIELDAAYTYRPTYAQVLIEYNRQNFKPVFMVEANYEFESLALTDGGSLQNLRRQEYWTMLSGATGQVYGSFYSWRFADGWKTNLDTPGVIQLGYMKDLFARRKWYDLIPDQTHEVVVAGYDGFSGLVGMLSAYAENYSLAARLSAHIRKISGLVSISTDTYVTAARTSNGSLVMAYLPSLRTITVDLSKLAGDATARWYDPASGEYRAADNSPLANAGTREFTPPGKNAAGDGDWVLVLETPIAR